MTATRALDGRNIEIISNIASLFWRADCICQLWQLTGNKYCTFGWIKGGIVN